VSIVSAADWLVKGPGAADWAEPGVVVGGALAPTVHGGSDASVKVTFCTRLRREAGAACCRLGVKTRRSSTWFLNLIRILLPCTLTCIDFLGVVAAALKSMGWYRIVCDGTRPVHSTVPFLVSSESLMLVSTRLH